MLLTTFSDTLANLLRVKLERLVHRALEMDDGIVVQSLDSLALQLYEEEFEPATIAPKKAVERFDP